ncbi:MAG: methionine--tRNA ligase subunit beta, partial [Chitinivibrionales bacterium]|nr:methionine--tRNA ligase subunit beta [Chitinivibrionales bacterium]MBD3358839.1 methionine--tRNA ligase subunit beta [Chitinivibrionales bacterium]
TKPWELVKNDPDAAARVMVTCANLVKALAVFLKPIVPRMAARLEAQFGIEASWGDYRFSMRDCALGKTEKLVAPIEKKEFESLFDLRGGKAAARKTEEGSLAEEGLVEIDDFLRTQLRIGTIRNAEKVEKSDKLIRLQVDDGKRERPIVAGIARYYTPEQLVGKQIVFVANLKPAKLMGLTSEGMVLAAQKGKKLVLLVPDGDIRAGAKVS